MQAKQQAHEGGLAGAVGPEQAQHPTGLDFESHIIDGNLSVLVDFGELVRFDHQIAGTLGHEAPSSTATMGCRH
jgi:hypothetical protein